MKTSEEILDKWITISHEKGLSEKKSLFWTAKDIIEGVNVSLKKALSIMDGILDCKDSEDLEIVKQDLSRAIMKIRDRMIHKSVEIELVDTWIEMKKELEAMIK